MTLEARATRAAGAVRGSVSGIRPADSFDAVLRAHRIGSALSAAAAGAALAAVIAATTLLIPTTPVADVTQTLPPATEITTETTVAPTEDYATEPIEAPPEEPIAGEGEGSTTAPPPSEGEGIAPLVPTEEQVEPAPDEEPPFIEITAPAEGARFSEDVIRFEGNTEPGATVYAGPYEADVTAEGHWAIVLVLRAGGNQATFVAVDAAGNEASASVKVFYDPPPPKEQEPGVEFSAFQTFGSCSEVPPYDIFSGTAKPGAKIKVTSEFGSGTTLANGEGGWEIKVFFPEAPYEEVFLVTVSDGQGNSKSFEFVAHAPA